MGELAGPLANDMSRNMEAAMRDLAEQFKALCFEFYTAKRRFTLLGPDGLTPKTMITIPTHLCLRFKTPLASDQALPAPNAPANI